MLVSKIRLLMQILFIGDIFGSAGRKIVRDHLGHVVETHKVDLVIANAENSAGGFGLTPAIADELFDLGCHVLTTGNHVWDKREIIDYFNSANGEPTRTGAEGAASGKFCGRRSWCWLYEGATRQGQNYAVINLQGRVFMHDNDDPFRKADALLAKISSQGSDRGFPCRSHVRENCAWAGIWMVA